MDKKKPGIRDYAFLHGMLFLYAAGGLASKTASTKPFLSFEFCLFYGIMLLNLMVYAILWQQVLKKFPLSTAFSNKAITVFWGMLWGNLVFHETITIPMVIGCVLIFCGIILVVQDDGQ